MLLMMTAQSEGYSDNRWYTFKQANELGAQVKKGSKSTPVYFFKMLNAKVAYARGRKLVDEEFEKWFRQCIGATTNATALKHFRLHFEAVLGFLKALRG